MEKKFIGTEEQLGSFDLFGLRKVDFIRRVSEKTEMFSREEARTYIDGCDYPESVDDLLMAWEIQKRFNHVGLENMTILDAMCGPGRLGRELLNLGAQHVVFHDGDPIMIEHAQRKAAEIIELKQNISTVLSLVDEISLPSDEIDLVVCHNSTHQLSSQGKLGEAMIEFVRLVRPGGFVMVADYQRNTTPEFLEALEERLEETKPEIIPLLIPTFMAAFSKKEWQQVLESTPGVSSFLVTDAEFPKDLTPKMWEKVIKDPVKGHLMDYGPISLRVLAQKKK